MYQKTKHKGKKRFCMHCLQNFTTEEILNEHKKHCLLIDERNQLHMNLEQLS